MAAIFVIYFAAAAAAYFTIAVPYLERTTELTLGADSLLYIDEAYRLEGMDLATLFPTTQNVVGPVLVLRALNYNNLLVFILNFAIFVASYLAIAPQDPSSRVKLLLLICLSPMTFVSLLTVNKEIFSLAGMAFLVCYLKTGKFRYVAIALFVSFFARWQQSVTTLAFIPVARVRSPQARISVLLALIGFISIAYPNFQLFPDGRDSLTALERNEWLEALNNLQMNYLYFIAVVPKFALNLIYPSNVLRFREVDYNNIYITYVMFLHPFYVLAVLARLSWIRRISIRSDMIYVILFFGIAFSTIPIIHTRYFFCLFPLLCLELVHVPPTGGIAAERESLQTGQASASVIPGK